MKVYTYSQARQNLAEVLNRSKSEDVLISRRGGDLFRIAAETRAGSPLDIKGLKTQAKTSDILAAIEEVRQKDIR